MCVEQYLVFKPLLEEASAPTSSRLHWQEDTECGGAGLAFDGNFALVFVNNFPDDVKPQPTAFSG